MIAFRILWATARKEPRAFAVSLCLQLLRFGLVLVPPLFVREVLDSLQTMRRLTPHLWWLLLLVFLTAASRVVFVLLATRYEGILKARITGSLTRSALRSALKDPDGTVSARPIGLTADVLSTDAAKVADQSVVAVSCAAMGVEACVAVALMFTIDSLAVLFLGIPVVLMAWVAAACRSRSMRLYKSERDVGGKTAQMINDLVEGAADLELAGAQAAFEDRLRATLDDRRVRTVRARMYSEVILGATMSNITALGIGAVLLVAFLFQTDGLTLGDFALLIAYIAAVLNFVANVGSLVAGHALASVAAGRLEATIPGTVDQLDRADADLPEDTRRGATFRSLTASHLTYLHPGTGHGIRDISFSVEHGQLVVIVGRVGSGKTTLLRSILQLVPLQAGSLRLNGAAIRPGAVPPNFAYIPQHPSVLSGTVRANIEGGLDSDDIQLDAALRASQLKAEVDELPAGVDTRLGSGGVNLSGGQVQRLAIARAHIRDPDAYVVDDPSSALDAHTERRMWRQLLDRDRVTCIAVTNRIWLLERADKVLVLHHGRLVASGTWRQVRHTFSRLTD